MAEQELLAETVELEASHMSTRELALGGVTASAFALAVAGLWLIRPPHGFAALPAFACLVVLVLAMLVCFDTPFGFAPATQLGFVPLLFAVPLALVPIAVALAMAASWLPDIKAGEVRPGRLLLVPLNSWFAIGAVSVLALAHADPSHAGAPLLLAALGAQFVADFIVSSVRFRITRGAALSSLARSTWVYVIDASLSGIALVVALDVRDAPLAALSLVPLLGLLAVFEQLGLSPERQRNLEFAALLHDVGKIAIPKEIINKPGKLDPHEWTIIKTHTVEGQKMLDRVGGFMRQVGIIVRSHHERWDGGGYPDSLAGEAIPLEARIITCCDTWNAMRTDRPYRKALSHDVAVAELVANAGGQFDPHVVETFLELVAPAEQADTAAVTAGGHVRAPAQLIAGSAGS